MSPARPPAARIERATRSAQVSMSLLRVAHHRRLAGGARRRVHAHHLLARHREHAERVVVAQVLLGGERELRQVGERLQVVGVHALRVEGLAVVRHVVVGALQRRLQALQLQRGELVAAGGLDRGRGRRASGCLTGIGVSPGGVSSASVQRTAGLPLIVYERPRNTATRSPRWFVTSQSYTPVRPAFDTSSQRAVSTSPSRPGATGRSRSPRPR